MMTIQKEASAVLGGTSAATRLDTYTIPLANHYTTVRVARFIFTFFSPFARIWDMQDKIL